MFSSNVNHEGIYVILTVVALRVGGMEKDAQVHVQTNNGRIDMSINNYKLAY
jgi:hypothetical protein